MKTQVLLKLNVEGFHRWPDAIEEVRFLADRHRHTFVITIAIGVSELDREREIFLERANVAEEIESRFGSPAEFGDYSCEHIALLLLELFAADWVEVWEEETGGARVEA